MMKKTFFTVALLSGLLLTSCNNRSTRSTTEVATVEDIEEINPDNLVVYDPIVTSTVRDNMGNTLVLNFDNDKGTATAVLNGETLHLKRDTTASGVRMHNDEYQYEEWQGNITLKKNGEVIFETVRDRQASVQNSAGDKLDITYNNNNNTAAIIYNGHVINLKADITASGIRYSNDEYVYEEWQGHSTLKKDGNVVFDSDK